MSERRIYVVVADRVDSPVKGEVRQPLGRQVAQACHVVGSLRAGMVWGYVQTGGKADTYTTDSHTTIILSARDSKELEHIDKLLFREKIPFVNFVDDNEEAYGKGVNVITALAVFPIEPVEVAGILDYLPLWGSSKHLGYVPEDV